jgi:hypothetical protein
VEMRAPCVPVCPDAIFRTSPGGIDSTSGSGDWARFALIYRYSRQCQTPDSGLAYLHWLRFSQLAHKPRDAGDSFFWALDGIVLDLELGAGFDGMGSKSSQRSMELPSFE